MKTLNVIFTHECNMRCSFCSQRDIERIEMNPLEVLQQVDTLCGKHKLEEVVLMGGEPLLFPELLNSLCYLLRRHQVKTILLTNGTLWTPGHTEWANANDIRVKVSVHSVLGEKPLAGLNCDALAAVEDLCVSKVVGWNEAWAECAWTIHHVLKAPVEIALDTHTLGETNAKNTYQFISQLEQIKASWLHVKGVFDSDCSCADHGMVLPDGKFLTRAAYLKLSGKTCNGCNRLIQGMDGQYEIFRKLVRSTL